ncbi:hypothetical protein Emed_005042 [Eimeria media]
MSRCTHYSSSSSSSSSSDCSRSNGRSSNKTAAAATAAATATGSQGTRSSSRATIVLLLMGLQLPPSVFSYSRLLRLLLDFVVVLGLLVSMLYVALDGNTWAATPLRLVPTLLGWTLFACSLLVTDKLYRLYTHWLRGWPTVKQQQQPAHAGLWRRPLCISDGEPDNLKRLTTTETLTATVILWGACPAKAVTRCSSSCCVVAAALSVQQQQQQQQHHDSPAAAGAGVLLFLLSLVVELPFPFAPRSSFGDNQRGVVGRGDPVAACRHACT